MNDDVEPAEQATGGRQERTVSVRLTVPEMDCPSCAQKVDKSLHRVAGVTDTTLQPTTGTATVTFDPDRASESDVTVAIANAGYDVVGDRDSSSHESAIAPPSEIWTSSRAIRTWIGAVAVTFGLLFEFVLTGQNAVAVTVLGRSLAVADGLFLVAIVSSGYPVVREGYYSAQNRSLDIDFLMGTAIIAATGIGYFVEAATLAVLFSIAELLEDYAMDRARNSLRELMELSPDMATVRRDGDTIRVPAEAVDVGEIVIVRPGEKIPLDGAVVEGESAVDESPITGESIPVDKSDGADVYAGSINTDGYLEVQVTSTAGDSTLARIIEMVQGAQEKKTDQEQFVDRFAGYFTPTVVVFALLTSIVPPLVFGGPWQTWFVRGLTLLVIACPCAFVISTPVSVVSGITSAAKNGVLIKGGNHLESMGAVDAVAIDKTGTLTNGELTVTDVVPLGDYSETDVLRYGGALEQRSEHPIAEAILHRVAETPTIDLPEPSDFESLTGKGVHAEIEGEIYYIGKPALFEELGVDLPDTRGATDGGAVSEDVSPESLRERASSSDHVFSKFQDDGQTVVLVGTDTEILGAIAIADEVRSNAQYAIEHLHDRGVDRVVMLTGDNRTTARAIAQQVGCDAYHAELLPDEKVTAVEKLQEEYGAVAMVGDGINDAPALAAADVGIAMGVAGTDTALETANVALMGDDIGKLPYLYALSHTANGVIRQNIWTSLGVKVLLAVGVPLGYVSVALAVVVGDMGMSLGVTGNAMRLSRLDPARFLDSS